MSEENQILIYQAKDGTSQLQIKMEADTIWLSQFQMVTLFDKDIRTINEHIQNIYNTGELSMDATIQKFRIVRQEGNRFDN